MTTNSYWYNGVPTSGFVKFLCRIFVVVPWAQLFLKDILLFKMVFKYLVYNEICGYIFSFYPAVSSAWLMITSFCFIR